MTETLRQEAKNSSIQGAAIVLGSDRHLFLDIAIQRQLNESKIGAIPAP